MLGILCQVCNQRPATSHLTEIDPASGSISELHICGSCIRQLGLDLHREPPPIAQILERARAGEGDGADGDGKEQHKIAIDLSPTKAHKALKPGALKHCPECGLSFANFSKNNRFGCPTCYDAFGDDLERALEELHGATRHVGRVPQSSAEDGEIRMSRRLHLQRSLEQAVADEDYERAAEIRDDLRRLEESGR